LRYKITTIFNLETQTLLYRFVQPPYTCTMQFSQAEMAEGLS